MSIDYSKLPRLAELCEGLSDDDLSIVTEVRCFSKTIFSLLIFSYRPNQLTQLITFSNDRGHTIDEMIAVLEQIQAAGFRGVERVAA